MTDLSTARDDRDRAMGDLIRAEDVAWRARVLAGLLAEPGLVYTAATRDPCGVHLVAADGVLLGEIRTTSPGALRDWYGYPAQDGETRRVGPFHLPRAAALALARGHTDQLVRHYAPDG
jgi:hypothetical protein